MNTRRLPLLFALVAPFVLSCDSEQSLLPTEVVGTTDLMNLALTAPSNLQGTATTTQVALTWTDNSSDEDGFRILRKTLQQDGTFTDWTKVGTVGANHAHFTDGSVQAGGTYKYRVRAFNSGGGSDYTNNFLIDVPDVIPAAPTNLQTAASPTQVDLTWTDNAANEDKFKVFRRKLKDDGTWSDWERIGRTAPNTTTFPDATVVAGRTYKYRVNALNSAGNSDYSNVAQVQVPQGPPAAPTNLQATPSSSKVDLTWTDNAANEDEFKVFRRKLKVDGTWNDWERIGTVGANTTAYSDNTVVEGKTYKYRVLAANADGNSDYSEVVETTVPASTPVTISTTSLSGARDGVAYSTDLAASGGTGSGYDWTVSAGSLPSGMSLSSGGTLSGTPTATGTFNFTARVEDSGANSDTQALSLEVCDAVLSLSVGQSVSVDLPYACGQVLPSTAGTYRVALMAREDGGGSASLSGGLRLAATGGSPGGAYPVPPVSFQSLALRGSLPRDGGIPEDIEELARRTEELSLRLREEEYHLRPNAPMTVPSVLGPPLPAVMAATYSPPGTTTFMVSPPAGGPRIEVNATLRAYNDYVLYYEDSGRVGLGDDADLGVNSDGSRATDQEITDVLDYYAAVGDNIIHNTYGGLAPSGTTNNFKDGGGNVLTLPTDDLDQNEGRIIVFQLRESRMLSGAAAYVSSCDRMPQDIAHYNAGGYYCTGSNVAEITYFRRPSSGFYWGTLVHETKHISSHGYAIFGGRGYNPSWIEEGTADMAKDKSSRDASGFSDGTRVGLWDIYDSGTGQVTGNTYGMGTVNSRARSYLKASPLGGLFGNPNPNPNGSTYYGASWLFHRWLTDAYGGGNEDTFLSTLNTGGAGVAQIESVTGKTLEELLAEWLVAIGVEGYASARSAVTKKFTSYDFAGIAAGWTGDWPYVQDTSAFTTANWSFDTTYSSANFFDFTSDGSTGMRLDGFNKTGGDLGSGDKVVMTIIRIG